MLPEAADTLLLPLVTFMAKSLSFLRFPSFVSVAAFPLVSPLFPLAFPFFFCIVYILFLHSVLTFLFLSSVASSIVSLLPPHISDNVSPLLSYVSAVLLFTVSW